MQCIVSAFGQRHAIDGEIDHVASGCVLENGVRSAGLCVIANKNHGIECRVDAFHHVARARADAAQQARSRVYIVGEQILFAAV